MCVRDHGATRTHQSRRRVTLSLFFKRDKIWLKYYRYCGVSICTQGVNKHGLLTGYLHPRYSVLIVMRLGLVSCSTYYLIIIINNLLYIYITDWCK